MLLEIILGAIAGTAAVTGLGIWYSKQKQKREEQEINKKAEAIESYSLDNRPLMLDLPIEKKLRDALFEAERSEEKCWREVMELFQEQKDLLKNIGKASYVALSQKDLYFELSDPKSGENRYYYRRDIQENRSDQFLEESKNLLIGYQDHIEILLTKIKLFQKLQVTHKEQLAKIDNIQAQERHWQKLKEHQKKLDALSKNTDIEVQSLRHQALLEEIERELEFQQDCLDAYQKLSDKFSPDLDESTTSNIKINIQNIIDQIDEDKN